MVEPATFAAFGLALVKTIICDMVSEATCSKGIFRGIACGITWSSIQLAKEHFVDVDFI